VDLPLGLPSSSLCSHPRQLRGRVGGTQVGLELYRSHQFLLGVGKLLLLEKGAAESVMQAGIVGIGSQQDTVKLLGTIVLSQVSVKIGQVTLGLAVGRVELQSSFEFGGRFFVLTRYREHASELQVGAGIVGTEHQ